MFTTRPVILKVGAYPCEKRWEDPKGVLREKVTAVSSISNLWVYVETVEVWSGRKGDSNRGKVWGPLNSTVVKATGQCTSLDVCKTCAVLRKKTKDQWYPCRCGTSKEVFSFPFSFVLWGKKNEERLLISCRRVNIKDIILILTCEKSKALCPLCLEQEFNACKISNSQNTVYIVWRP